MTFPQASIAQWRALAAKESAGGRALANDTFEDLALAALYTEAPPTSRPGSTGVRVGLCTRHLDAAPRDELLEDIAGGADALWLPLLGAARASAAGPLHATLVLDVDDLGEQSAVQGTELVMKESEATRFIVGRDPIARAASLGSVTTLHREIAALAHDARLLTAGDPRATACVVSGASHHEAGADAADEIAIMLATGARYLGAMLQAGISVERAAGQIALRVAVGRDTFTELCKLRSLRWCWRKVLAASGARAAPPTIVHAVCASRTLTVRDPWVNMLRATTQVFAAILGGADLVTPTAFDEAIGEPSALGRRVARNTALVLRDESFLGQVTDAAGGAYAFETVTDALAREAWGRFRAIEAAGGVVAEIESGRLQERLAAARRKEIDAIARRKQPILGVSEFANLDEVLPVAIRARAEVGPPRDAEAFEDLRARATGAPEVLLVPLGSFSEARPRVGFATSFFAAGGLRAREAADGVAVIACLCGSDAVYAEQAEGRARALKAAGCRRVLLAGRPGPLEASLRAAGVDGFIFVGCDAIAVLSELLEVAT